MRSRPAAFAQARPRRLCCPFQEGESRAKLDRMARRRTVRDVFPAFVDELVELCRRAGSPELGEQIPELPVVARCTCGQNNCAHFYTAPPPLHSYPPGHRNVVLPAKRGLIVLCVVDERVVAVEVLDRHDVKARLDAHLPPGDG
jgi:hypothetical protein